VFYGAEVTVPQNVTRTGYTFVGWSAAPVQTMPAESLTYQAVWQANRHTVLFDKDHPDATGEMAPQAFTYDVPAALTANAFVRQHYDFAGWATQANGAVIYAAADIDKAAIGTTLYAVWTEAVDNNENIENAEI
jgi:uncharacterized repeat protein (TIGR02543 family)